MKAHDIVVLLKVLPMEKGWQTHELAASLFLSEPEIRASIIRSIFSRLLSYDKGFVMRRSFFEFLVYGMKYAFPAEVGKQVIGIATSHSAPILKPYFIFDQYYVWPSSKGDQTGNAVQPFYKNQTLAALSDPALYDKLALLDALRVGRTRECNKAVELLDGLINTRS